MARETAPRPDQYAHTAWKLGDGSFKGYPRALAQTPDGYLWIGTEFGLIRFDGVRFVAWRPPDGQNLPSDSVVRLLAGRDGSLWIGTMHGLARLQNGRLTRPEGVPNQYVGALAEDLDGTLWVGTSGGLAEPGQLCSIRAVRVACIGADGTFGRFVSAIHRDRAGVLWVGAATGLWEWAAGRKRAHGLDSAFPEIRSILSDGGDLLVSSSGGLHRLAADRDGPRRVSSPSRKPTVILKDRYGALWTGTQDAGLAHVAEGHTARFGTTDGLSGAFVGDLLEDREGNVWVATLSGLDRFRRLSVWTVSARDGLSSNTVLSVLAGSDGSVWIGTPSGLNRWRRGEVSILMPRSSIQSLFEDRDGQLWVASSAGLSVRNGDHVSVVRGVGRGFVHAIAQNAAGDIFIADQDLGLLRVKGREVIARTSRVVFSGRTIRALAADSTGGLWVGFFEGGLVYLRDGVVREEYSVAQGIHQVNHLAIGADGTVWAATSQGVARIAHGQVTTVLNDSPPGCDASHWLVNDGQGSDWLYTACGIARFDRGGVARAGVAGGPVTILDSTDGVMLTSGLGSYSPKVTQSADGLIWFAGYSGVSVLDPARLHLNRMPPPVHIEGVSADDTAYTAVQPLQFDFPLRDLRIDFTATSLAMPSNVRFRYMLEGRDRNWIDGGSRRQAIYTDLAPRSYRFRVVASNNHGVWNEMGAATTFTILPAFYQTVGFKISVASVLTIALWSAYRLRMIGVANRLKERFEGRLDERVRIAQELHDTLLQGILSTAMQLDVVADEFGDHPSRPKIVRILAGIRRVAEDGRLAISELRFADPPEELEATLLRDGHTLRGDLPVELRVAVEGTARPLNPLVREEVHRIGREALVNAFRHARSTQVDVVLAYQNDCFKVHIRDNGCGIPAVVAHEGRGGHWGLQGMRERADRIGGRLQLLSRPQTGTEVILTVPGASAFASR